MSLVTNPSQITLAQVVLLCNVSKGAISRLYLHWTAGRYSQCFDDYHLNIGPNGELYLTCRSLEELKAHTWHRNTGAVGLTICACLGAVALQPPKDKEAPAIDFGPFEPTPMQIEKLALVIAVITQALGLDLSEEAVMTHCEAAIRDGYGPYSGDPETRWDLWYVKDYPYEGLVEGGRLLRGKALWYRAWLDKFNVFEVVEPR